MHSPTRSPRSPHSPPARAASARAAAMAGAATLLLLSAPARAAVVTTYPLDGTRTGFIDEFGFRFADEMVSGSVMLVGFGQDTRAFAEFDLTPVPDTALISAVRLKVWLSNHDNPGDPAVPLDMEVHGAMASASDTAAVIYSAIGPLGGGNLYIKTSVARTGVEFCPDSFVLKEYVLGPSAIADVQSRLTANSVMLGFVSSIVTDPSFDHIDYIGFTEDVPNPICPVTSLPGSRIALEVSFSQPVPGSGCEPRNHGFWHRYCLGQDAIDPGRKGGGNGPDPSPQHDDLPPGLIAIADAAMAPWAIRACPALDEGPFSDPRLAALRELATIHLNLAAGLLRLDCAVELHPVDDRSGLTVKDAIDEMTARLSLGTVEALHEARWIGEHVVNGEALLP